jgi:hypothetical protein
MTADAVSLRWHASYSASRRHRPRRRDRRRPDRTGAKRSRVSAVRHDRDRHRPAHFAEGLAIGNCAAAGEISLAAALVTGFC